MVQNGKIRRAPGFADRAGRDFERLDTAIRTAREVLAMRGYEPLDTPLLEKTELFLRRSGGLLSSQMFDFTAPDGSEISLRPELTAPVIRYALEHENLAFPLRYQYAAPIFRYTERPFDAPPNSVPSKRQFIQAGAELIGAAQPAADGEIISTAYEMAKRVGVGRVAVRIGHVGLIWEILERFNLSDRAKLFLANRVSELAKCDDDGPAVEAEAVRRGLMHSPGQQSVETQSSAADLLTRLASGSVQLPSETEQSSRTAEDVVQGLRRKLEHEASNRDFTVAMELMRKVARLKSGTVANEIVSRTRDLMVDYGLDGLDSLDDLAQVEQSAEIAGVPSSDISIDLGLATSMGYYSGMIFEVCAESDDGPIPIGGGGRYDGLAASLGSHEKLPALGFALNLDTILDITNHIESAEYSRQYVVLAPLDAHAGTNVLKAAADLRAQGKAVISLFDQSIDARAVAASMERAEVVRVRCDSNPEGYKLVRE